MPEPNKEIIKAAKSGHRERLDRSATDAPYDFSQSQSSGQAAREVCDKIQGLLVAASLAS